jgi:hypothetical protein
MMENAAAAKMATLIFVFSNVYRWLVDILAEPPRKII